MTTQLPEYHNMTETQRETMKYIVFHINETGESPTLDEIAIHFDRHAPNVHKTVKRLVELGHLVRKPGAIRGLTLPEVKA